MDNDFSLNLPEYDAKIRREGTKTKIFDMLRRKFVSLTPEEWVRQHFVNYLINFRNYPAALMANEVTIELNSMKRRCDTVVYDRHLRPKMIIEYKRPNVAITKRVFGQISRYNMVMKVDYLVVSNGKEHYCCKMNYEMGTYEFLSAIPEIRVNA